MAGGHPTLGSLVGGVEWAKHHNSAAKCTGGCPQATLCGAKGLLEAAQGSPFSTADEWGAGRCGS